MATVADMAAIAIITAATTVVSEAMRTQTDGAAPLDTTAAAPILAMAQVRHQIPRSGRVRTPAA
jgi:hypothetical protein